MAPYLEGNFEYACVPQPLVALSNDHAPVFAPGERFDYSNTIYVIIGLIIEKLTGLSLADAVAQRITGPLGMTTTSTALSPVSTPSRMLAVTGAARSPSRSRR